jgi:hypothetical protein
MARCDLSLAELFALVWEKPSREVANELGVSDVVIGKLSTRGSVLTPRDAHSTFSANWGPTELSGSLPRCRVAVSWTRVRGPNPCCSIL